MSYGRRRLVGIALGGGRIWKGTDDQRLVCPRCGLLSNKKPGVDWRRRRQDGQWEHVNRNCDKRPHQTEPSRGEREATRRAVLRDGAIR